jgi:formylglycine-generating enzyme required for sulfatase activity
LCALAQYDAGNARWQAEAPVLAGLLVNESPAAAGRWADQCRLVRSHLVPSIAAAFDGHEQTTGSRVAAAYVLSVLLADDPARIAEFLAIAERDQLGPLLKVAGRQKQQTAAAVETRLSTLPTSPAADGSDEPAAKQQGNLCLALLVCDAESAVWRRLADGRDPRARSYLIHSAAAGPISADRLADLLVASDNADAQYTLLLMLGALEPGDVRGSHATRLRKWLLSNYRENPDSGVHSAIEWLHRVWQRENDLSPIQIDLMREGPRPERHWYHNSLGQCLVIVDGPVTFLMGSPDDEPGHGPNELQHQRTIRRRFAVATTETTRGQMRQSRGQSASDAPDGPAEGITYEAALEFCRWLSRRESIQATPAAINVTSDEEKEEIAIDLRQDDYRVPSEPEWEFACRAGTITARCFGSSATPLESGYAHYSDRQGVAAVGGKMPNRLGLFDVYGNVEEWTIGRLAPYSDGASDDADQMNFREQFVAVRRGGSSSTRPQFFRSALRTPITHTIGVNEPDESVGLRIARTLPPVENLSQKSN